jgi:hypothetical protein
MVCGAASARVAKTRQLENRDLQYDKTPGSYSNRASKAVPPAVFKKPQKTRKGVFRVEATTSRHFISGSRDAAATISGLSGRCEGAEA